LVSFSNRYLKETPSPKHLDRDLLDRIIKSLVNDIKLNLNSQADFEPLPFILSKKGPLRSRYLNAHNKNVRRGVPLREISDIGAFVKNERYFEEKSPRMIMGRNPRFNMLYARFIEPVERAFFKLEQVANACDYYKCGQKFTNLVGQWFFENDMSKFEASQRWETLRLEYLVYSLLFPSDKQDLDVLFAAKMLKHGRTTAGVKFMFDYCRGSGDMDTGLGNGILNYIATTYFQAVNFCPRRERCRLGVCCEGCVTGKFVIKGDDSYGCMPVNAAYINTYEYFGFDAKLIIKKMPHEVEFCSGHFVRQADGTYYYVQKLRKLLTSIETVINDDITTKGHAAHYYRSLGLMYKKLYAGIPVYEDLADYLMTACKHGLNLNLTRDTSYGLTEAFEHFERQANVSDQTLVDISLVNDMSFAELDALCRSFRMQTLVLPDTQYRKCNTKARATKDQLATFEVEYWSVYSSMDQATLHSRQKKFLTKLRSLRHWRTRLVRTVQ